MSRRTARTARSGWGVVGANRRKSCGALRTSGRGGAVSEATPFSASRPSIPTSTQRILDFVEWKLIEMPIPRLQGLGRGEEDRFLYEYNWPADVRRAIVSAYQGGASDAFSNVLWLQPGVAEGLVRLNGLVRPIFYREWAVRVAKLNRLPEAGLESFLFDVDRASLNAVRKPLCDLQSSRCFYCDERIMGRADVDHFIPWSRYRDGGLDNLVPAHLAGATTASATSWRRLCTSNIGSSAARPPQRHSVRCDARGLATR